MCELRGRNYLILVDYYYFIEVDYLKETTSEQVITRCKSQFARHGIPDIFFTDNGPQFSSDKFWKFAIAYQFEHHTSSPYYPQSNGKAEKAVQTVKNILKKVLYDGRDPYLALLDLCNTPVNDKIGSPAQQLMGRRTKTLLPTTKRMLLPKTIQASTVKSNIALQQQRQKHYYDRCSKPLPQLNIGDNVRVQGNNEWKLTGTSPNPQSYAVTTTEGQTIRRNRKHLRKSQTEYDNDDTELNERDEEEKAEIEQKSTENGQETGSKNTGTPPETPQLRRSGRSVTKPDYYANSYTLQF